MSLPQTKTDGPPGLVMRPLLTVPAGNQAHVMSSQGNGRQVTPPNPASSSTVNGGYSGSTVNNTMNIRRAKISLAGPLRPEDDVTKIPFPNRPYYA